MSKKERMLALLAEADQITKKAADEERAMTDEERETVREKMGQAMELRDEIKSDEHDVELKAQLAELLDGVKESEERSEPNPPAPKGTLGERFLNSPEWKGFVKRVAPSGQFSTGKFGHSPAVMVKDFGLWRKELITGVDSTSAGAFIVPDDTGIYEPIGRYPRVLRDLIAIRQTGSDTVEFVRQTKQVTEAEPTPEANVKYPTGATGEIDGTKPQGEMTFERVAEVVKTIAVYVGATKRALADAAQIRGIIDQELREDLYDCLEWQLFNGNGVGENFTGMANQAGTLVQAFNTDILITARQAITNLLINGRQIPTAFVFNPQDWETVELLQDANNRFYGNGPWNQGPMRLWGVPVAQSFHLAQGTSWLGNWRKAVLWDRMQATITATDSHDDWFIRNMVAILAELRAAFGLIRPSAFVEIDLEAGS
jgi:HK97 family phage major capsid protein